MYTVKPLMVYPGGKSKAVKRILPHIPENEDILSPFLGMGSIELNLAHRGQRVYAFDAFEPLVNFWKVVLSRPEEIAKRLPRAYPIPQRLFTQFQKDIYDRRRFSAINRAVKYVLISKSQAFGGRIGTISVRSNGLNGEVFKKRVAAFRAPNLIVDCLDFKESLAKYPDMFVYADPPYPMPGTSANMYGVHGEFHRGFDHEGLAKLMLARRAVGWVMSYKDDPLIRRLYKGCQIVPLGDYGWRQSFGNWDGHRKVTGEVITNKEVLIFP